MRVAIASMLLATCVGAVAAEWETVPETSTVAMYATKQGAMFSGVFEEFTATIDFDTASPEAGRIAGIVNTASVDTQDSQNDTYVLGYLRVEEFPQARFESRSIQKTAEGYRASGELSLAGHEKPATMDFSFVPGSESSAPGISAKFTATMTINRFDFDIASDIDTIQAGRDVIVYIELNLKR